MKETELFQPVREWLEAQGFTVHSEVPVENCGRPDVVGVRGPELVVVELKTSLSLDVLDQAYQWTNFAQRSFAAVPLNRKRSGFPEIVCCRFGIGLLEVVFPGPDSLKKVPYVQQSIRAEWNRRVLPNVRDALREEQRCGPAGGLAGGGYVTDYKLTMEKVRNFLRWRTRDGNWVPVSEILNEVETHYASPRPALGHALSKYESEWCERQLEGGKLYFRYKAAPRGKES